MSNFSLTQLNFLKKILILSIITFQILLPIIFVVLFLNGMLGMLFNLPAFFDISKYVDFTSLEYKKTLLYLNALTLSFMLLGIALNIGLIIGAYYLGRWWAKHQMSTSQVNKA